MQENKVEQLPPKYDHKEIESELYSFLVGRQFF